MATVSFEDAGKEQPAQSCAVVPVEPKQSTALATPAGLGMGSGISGEVTMRDIQKAYLSLIQKTTNNIPDGAKPGQFLFNKSVIVGGEKTDMIIIPVHLEKCYEEKLEFGSDESPQIFATLAEAKSAGFSLDYSAEKVIVDRGDIAILLAQPEALEKPEQAGMFPYEFKGKKYALAQWTVRGSSFKHVAKPLITACSPLGHLKGRLYNGYWLVSSRIETSAKNSWFVPVLKPGELVGPEIEEFLKALGVLA